MEFVIKVTRKCNLNCKYCCEHLYSTAEEDFTQKKLKTLYGKIYDYYHKYPGIVSFAFAWHGGEPMYLPASFYRGALDLQKEIFKGDKFKIRNIFQTNLTLLDDEYLELFKTGEMGRILVSFDVINDNRVFRNGKPTEGTVIKNLDILKREGVDHAGFCVLTKQNINHMDEIYDFFKQRNMSFGTLPVRKVGTKKKDEFGVTPQEYTRVSPKLFDRWFYDDETNIAIFEFVNMIKALTRKEDEETDCFFAKNCVEQMIYFNPDGTTYNCSGMDFGQYVYGNIFKQSMAEIMESKARKRLLSRFERIEDECGKCAYFKCCYGGCPNIGREETNFWAKSPLCPYFKTMFAHIEKRLRENDLLTEDGRLREDL